MVRQGVCQWRALDGRRLGEATVTRARVDTPSERDPLPTPLGMFLVRDIKQPLGDSEHRAHEKRVQRRVNAIAARHCIG